MLVNNRISAQEDKDFKVAKKALERIFGKERLVIKKEPEYSHTDLRFTASTSNNIEKHYNVELKERNYSSEMFDEVPLKMSKYIDIINNTRIDEEAFIMYLMPKEIWIFNLTKLDLNKVKYDNWEIKDVEYSENSRIIRTPTMFIPLKLAVWNTINS